MSSNEPSLPEDETTHILNQAIKTLNVEPLHSLISKKGMARPLDPSFLEQAWAKHKNTCYLSPRFRERTSLLITLFNRCHYPRQQRFLWIQTFVENALTYHNVPFIMALVSHLHPVEDLLPLATHLTESLFFRNDKRLTVLLQRIPQDVLPEFCRQIMTPSNLAIAKQLITLPLPEPLLKALVCFLSDPNNTDAVLAALSEDWQTVFAGVSFDVLCTYERTLITRDNLTIVLASRDDDQRLKLLQALVQRTSAATNKLCHNENALRNVLELLPKSQRVQWLLTEFGQQPICNSVPDAMWSVIQPLLEPSDMATIFMTMLTHRRGKPTPTLINSVSIEDGRQVWQRMPDRALSLLLAEPDKLMTSLNHLPTEVQGEARERLLANLFKYHHIFEYHDIRHIKLQPWLDNETCFAALFPAANQWLGKAANLRKLPFNQRLSTLATSTTALHAFLDHIPASERHILITWFMNTQDTAVFHDLMNHYADTFCLAYILPGNWHDYRFDWTEKMPLVLSILERLPERERPRFTSQFAPWTIHPWQPETYQVIRHAHALFGKSAEHFMHLVGLSRRTRPTPPLIEAVQDNNMEMVKAHIQSLNEQDFDGMTALMHAYHTNKPEIATFLAKQPHCDFSLRTLSGYTALGFAVASGNRRALHDLFRIDHCKPDARDALDALYIARDHPEMIAFLFEACLPGVVWQHESNTIPDPYRNSATFQAYHAKALLPFNLARKQLTVLELDPTSPAVFGYQMRALGIPAADTMKLEPLLQALTGQMLETLRLTGFHVTQKDLPALLEFVKNNPQLKVLSLESVHLYLEDRQAFIDELARLEHEHRTDIDFIYPSGLPCQFFKPAVRKVTGDVAQAFESLRL